MKLTVSQMKYMLVLGELDRGSKIRCTDVARRRQVKKPCVCGMMCRLESMGLLRQDPYSVVRFTEEGRHSLRLIPLIFLKHAAILQGFLMLTKRWHTELSVEHHSI